MHPLVFSRTAIASSIAIGIDATVDALRRRRTGLAPCAFETVQLETCVGQVADADLHAGASGPRGFRLPQQSPGSARAQSGRIRAGRAGGTRKARRRPHRRVPWHQHIGDSFNRTGLSPPRSGKRRVARGLSLRRHAQYVLRRLVRAVLSRPAWTVPGGFDCVLFKRQGVRHSGAHDRGRLVRRRSGRRRGQPVPDYALWLQLARPAFGRILPAFRQRRDGISIGEGAGFILLEKRAANSAAGRSGAARRRREQRCLSHVLAASRWSGCTAGNGRRAAGCRAGAGRNRLYQPARHRYPGQRCDGRQGGGPFVRQADPLQFHQRLDRAYPGGMRSDRGDHLDLGDRKWFPARQREHAQRRSGDGPALSDSRTRPHRPTG